MEFLLRSRLFVATKIKRSIRDIADRIMTSQEIQVLYRAYQSAGFAASRIKPNNPFEKSGGTACLLQAAVSQVDPAQAIKWLVESGISLNIATLAEM